jgi:hypothetical protein
MDFGQILSHWDNGVPKQVRFANGDIDNYCLDCGNRMHRFVPSAVPGTPGWFIRDPAHNLQCESRDFTVKEAA